jgi:hypothetical protein
VCFRKSGKHKVFIWESNSLVEVGSMNSLDKERERKFHVEGKRWKLISQY